jgi:hypothetical protein
MKRGKKGAVEMSMGTIVVIVLAVSMLILGMIFVRSIMCSGIMMSEQISEGVQNEIRGLFGADDYGVKCMGEGGEEITIADGGTRRVGCVIKTDEGGQYSLRLTEIKSLTGAPTNTVQSWVVDSDYTGYAGVGDSVAEVVILNIPKNTPTTTIKLTIEETAPAGTKKTHISLINIEHVGAFTSAIC